MSEELHVYKLFAHMAIETKEEHVPKILEELTDAIIQISEHYESFCGGGFSLQRVENEEEAFTIKEMKIPDSDPNEDFNCMHCNTALPGYYLFCSEICSKASENSWKFIAPESKL